MSWFPGATSVRRCVVTSAAMAAVCGWGLLAPFGGRLLAGQRGPLLSRAAATAAAPLYDVVVSGGGMVGSAMAAVLGKPVTFSPAAVGVACAIGSARCRPRAAAVTAAQPAAMSPSRPCYRGHEGVRISCTVLCEFRESQVLCPKLQTGSFPKPTRFTMWNIGCFYNSTLINLC